MVLAGVGASVTRAWSQGRPFIFSLVPRSAAGPEWSLFGDVAYGRHLFAALGPEELEQRVGVEVRLGRRITAVAQGGWASTGDSPSQVTAQLEVLENLAPRSDGAVLAVGLGAMRDYNATAVGLGRIVGGWRWRRALLVANIRLEHPFQGGTTSPPRDVLDLNTSVGFVHDLTPAIRIGIESVAEDLEGLLEPDEAEGGAKVMLGPTLSVGRRASRWGLGLSAGPVLRLSQSSAPGTSGASRELYQPGGFIVRTSVNYAW
jgi:hypothetical protein